VVVDLQIATHLALKVLVALVVVAQVVRVLLQELQELPILVEAVAEMPLVAQELLLFVIQSKGTTNVCCKH
jgi:hypothetical protein